MLKKSIAVTLLVSLFAVSGCVEGVSMYETPGAMAGPPAGMARIIVYRPAEMMGAGVQPVVRVGQRETGRCAPNGVFSIDVAPGEHNVSATTEVTSAVLVELDAGEVAYIRCGIGFGFFVGQPRLTLVERSIGRGESANLVLTEAY